LGDVALTEADTGWAQLSTRAKVMSTVTRSSVNRARLLTRLGRLGRVIQLQLAAAGNPARLHLAVAGDPRRSGYDGPRSRHRGAGGQQPGFGHVLVLIQNHGPSVDPRNHCDMHAGDHARMHTCDNAVVNERHSVNANHRLHPCDRHNAVDMPHIVRLRDVPVFDLAYVTIFRSRDVIIARASFVAVSVDIADSLYGLVPIDGYSLLRWRPVACSSFRSRIAPVPIVESRRSPRPPKLRYLAAILLNLALFRSLILGWSISSVVGFLRP
jgi:hypothetical protein